MYGKEFYKSCIESLVKFLLENGFTSAPTPPIHLHRDSQDEQNPFKQFTGYFNPESFEIHLFLYGRHPKDVLRTLAHELVHVRQFNENRLAEGGADLKDDPELRDCELEAFTQGNLGFREWTEQMGQNDFGEDVIVETDEVEPTVEEVSKFLTENRDTILEGLDYLEQFYNLGLEGALKEVGFRLDVVPDNKWNPHKHDPTETSEDEHTVRIKQSYLEANPNFCNFQDEYGWALHEMVHAVIFSGNMPSKFLNINSPFWYPMNTHEIYAFGFQLKHIYGTDIYKNLLDNYREFPGCEDFENLFEAFAKTVLSKQLNKDFNEREANMKINENTKVTLTIGQLKKLVKESANEEWCVVYMGGSIGKAHKYHCRYGACSIVSDNLTQDDAKEEAKTSRKFLTSTDKYYGITYRALPRSDVKEN